MELLFVSVKLVKKYTGLQTSAAQRKLRKVRQAYNIPLYGDVNVFIYCDYYHMDVDRFIRFIDDLDKKEELERKQRSMKGT